MNRTPRDSDSVRSPCEDEIRELQRALAVSREFFHAIVNCSGDGILVLNMDGAILFANPAAERLLGREVGELLGFPFGLPTRPGAVSEIELPQQDRSLRVAEMRVVETAWQGRPAYVATLRDITGHKQARLNALKAVERRDRFLALLSHELRTPVAAMSNASQVLIRDPDVARDDIMRIANVMQRQCQQLKQLLDDLLNVSRISRGQIRLRRKPTDLLEVIDHAVEMVSPLFAEKGHEFQMELPEQSVYIDGDSVRLAQIITNLLTNSNKYTEPGGWIRLSCELEADQVVIRVQDDGIGIPADKLHKVFEPFVQAVHTVSSLESGLGVGLAVVRDLVALHGGSTEVHSPGVNRGATFSVRLPLLPPERRSELPVKQRETRQAPAKAAESAGAIRVLLVEDVEDIRQMMRMVLEIEGFEVVVAEDGRTGLKRASVFHPDVALVDIGLPEIDGYEVARQLRAEFGTALHLVALTGYGQDADIHKAHEAGFDQHLTKPVDCDYLVSLIRDARRKRVEASTETH